MNGCQPRPSWRWLVLSVGLLWTAAAGAACEATSPASSRIRRDVALLACADGNIQWEAYQRLLKDGSAAVPALVATLERQDATYHQSLEVIRCLGHVQSFEAVLALVRFSDREGWFLVTGEIAGFPHVADWDRPAPPVGRKHLALEARQAIGMIIDRSGRSTWGGWRISGTDAHPGTEEYYGWLQERKAYWRKVNSWYQEWREGFDPASKACHPPL